MIYIENTNNDPRYNLAFEEYFFYSDKFDDAILLLWQNGPSVIIGKYQNTAAEVNQTYIDENEIKVVRRNTGGGAVYHDLGNLNYSFIVPDVAKEIDFHTFTKPLIKALETLGVKTEQTGRNDVTIDGMKFSGNAQQYRKNKLLHHGTIMFDVNIDAVTKSLNVKADKLQSKGIKSVRSRVTNLKKYLPEGMSALEFKEALKQAFDEEYDLKVYEPTEEDLDAVNKLFTEKFSTWDWNYGKSLAADIVKGGRFNCGYVEFNIKTNGGLIEDVKLVGDFFSSREIGDLEEALKGVKYNTADIRKVLEDMDAPAYLGDITMDELMSLII